MLRVNVTTSVIEWALARSGDPSALEQQFPRIKDWRAGESSPTLRQLEQFARAARVPFGFLLLSEPPDEPLPIKDLRTVATRGVRRPSPDMLDVVYLCQRRQAWYQQYAEAIGDDPRTFVGSATLDEPPASVARRIATTIGYQIEARSNVQAPVEPIRLLVERAEEAGVLVMISGIVGSNTRRALDPEEFRGFALADRLAPLVFVNGADTRPAQLFTLAHELAHIWLGESAVGDASPAVTSTLTTERWCNEVAAELLVPLKVLRELLADCGEPLDLVRSLSRHFRVSTLVILRRLHDAGRLTEETFRKVYQTEMQRLIARMDERAGGGNFYNTQPVRLSPRFARAVIASTYEGQTLFKEALGMLGVRKEKTLRGLGKRLGVLN
jgi:Zn-dependent peptidase ImmA (M78 family)